MVEELGMMGRSLWELPSPLRSGLKIPTIELLLLLLQYNRVTTWPVPIRAMSSTSTTDSSLNAQQMTEQDQVQQIQLLTSTNDDHGGVIVDIGDDLMDSTAFLSILRASISHWKQLGKRGVWIKLPIHLVSLVETLVKEGFWYHHAEPKYLMLVHWIPESGSTIPANASHRVGVGALVVNEKREILVVQERSGYFQGTGFWKFPTGVVDQGEDICVAAVREVKEETGVDSEFVEILAFSQSHKTFFEKSDLYFVCLMRPLSLDIQIQETEIEAAQWMSFDEYAAQPLIEKHERLKFINEIYLAKIDGLYAGFTPVAAGSNFSKEKNYLYLNAGGLKRCNSFIFVDSSSSSMEEFVKEFGEHYGYPNGPKSIDEIRATEFNRLQGLVYLDHAGATLYSELQMQSVFGDLATNVYGNPHSQSESSSATLDILIDARQQVLDYCNASAKDYKCIFTSGATAALKLVGEAFPWSCNNNFMYTMENHNSVLGIREYALDKGATAIAVDIEEDVHPLISEETIYLKISPHEVQRRKVAELSKGQPTGDVYNLFAFPSECNFSGLRFDLDMVKIIKENSRRISGISSVCKNGQWMVLIDAAKGCATAPPDLSKYPADFVTISFYKLFGYPTGLGALIVRNDAAKLLKKTYFSGGTVAASIADIDFIKRRERIEELFEDGTVSFLSIVSIRHGFKILNSLTVSAISRHTTSLTLYTRKMLLALRHGNGSSVCVLYRHHKSMERCHEMGPIVTFNLKRPDGSWYGYREVEKLASLSGIQLRTGCFCNPGACAKYLGLSHLDLLSNTEAGHVCWDDHDIINGKPTGAVRVSFGYMSTFEETKKFIDFVACSFMSSSNHVDHGNYLKGLKKGFLDTDYHLKSITIYPIKSCGGFCARSWPLCNNGLKHDREWILKSLSGETLTQKKVPEMCFINTFIDLSQGMLFVESPRCKGRLQIRLETDVYDGAIEDIELYGHRYKVYSHSNETNEWFSEATGKPCTLLRYSSCYQDFDKTNGTVTCRDANSALNFSNEGQFLLVSEESVSDLNKRLSSDMQKGTCKTVMQVDTSRFRPNLVVSGGRPYEEDGWRDIRIGNVYFRSIGGCNRCQVINIAQIAGQVQKSKEPLATLASYRRVKGKILFGILLKYASSDGEQQQVDSWLHVGQDVHPDSISFIAHSG
ncbi:hypothetical protein RIF29_08271 [Crotalaria pallida]|uniref:Molybdenum cofactor sulfurase n=1 Tax=Crotalaria pallida TaxID=3830 RepID=A0AAN9PBC1_CROPI